MKPEYVSKCLTQWAFALAVALVIMYAAAMWSGWNV